MVCNFTPVERKKYRIGMERPGVYKPVLSSDAAKYGGTGARLRSVTAKPIPMHGREYSVELTLPPLSTVFYERQASVNSRRKRSALVSKKDSTQKKAGKRSEPIQGEDRRKE